MSSYSNTRRAPNVSQYLANLNLPAGARELPAQDEFGGLGDNGLDFLTNAEFFDFDNFDGNVADFPQSQAGTALQKARGAAAAGAVDNSPPYQFGEFQTYPGPVNASPNSTMPSSPQSGLHGQYPPQPPHFGQASAGDKRKASTAGVPTTADLEEASRLAAEEDKRRRNTAASARFRIKKKQREQALEKQAKDMTEKVQMLEGKVQQLEMENKWLKGLITEKSSAGDSKGADAKADRREKDTSDRSTESRNDGVGTQEGEDVKGVA